jgi:hypothetical protein
MHPSSTHVPASRLGLPDPAARTQDMTPKAPNSSRTLYLRNHKTVAPRREKFSSGRSMVKVKDASFWSKKEGREARGPAGAEEAQA